MSGPKTVNIRIYDPSLCEIVQHQAELVQLVDTLEEFSIQDSRHGVSFDGKGLIPNLRQDLDKCLQNVEMPRHQELNRGENRLFKEALQAKRKELQSLKEKVQAKLELCETIRNDYQASLVTLEELTALQTYLKAKLEGLHLQISTHFQEVAQQLAPSLRDHTQNALQKLHLEFDKPVFDLTLHQSKNHLLEEAQACYHHQQQQLFDLQAAYCASLNLSCLQIQNHSPHWDSVNQQLVGEIEILFSQLHPGPSRDHYASELKTWQSNPESAYAKDLTRIKAEFQEMIANQSRRTQLQDITSKLCALSCTDESTQLLEMITTELARDIIPESHYQRICLAWESIQWQCRRQRQESYARTQECKYIKSKLVEALRELNYEVVEAARDLLEDGSSILFRVPRQDNYINLEYLKGKFFYNFLVPEKISQLTRDELKRKVTEMGEACDGFVKALELVKSQGLEFELKHLESSEKHLITVPESIRSTHNLVSEDDLHLTHSATEQRRMQHD